MLSAFGLPPASQMAMPITIKEAKYLSLGYGRAVAGVAAVEFALAATVLVIVLTPVVDLGMAFYQQMQVQDAAQAGAQYAAAKGWNSSGIQNAVTSASTNMTISASPAPSESCGCPNGTSVVTATCNSSCTNGQTAGTYVTVNAQASYTPILPYSFFGSSTTLAATSTVRIK